MNNEKSLEGNRAYRRRKAAIERSKKKTPLYLSADWKKKKEMVQLRVENKIKKVKARKVERLAKLELAGGEGSEASKSLKKKMSPAEIKQAQRKVKTEKFKAKMKKLVGVSAVLLSMMFGSNALAYHDQLDPRYLAEYQENASSSVEYLYNGVVSLPLEAIFAAQWYGAEGSYKPTVIYTRYYFKGELVDVSACVKYLNWWEPEEAICR